METNRRKVMVKSRWTGRGVSTALLQWVELCGLKLDHGRIRKTYPEDAWWLSHSAGVTGPHRFKQVLSALLDGAGSVQYVHESAAADDPPPWRTLSYCPLWLHSTFLKWWESVFRLADYTLQNHNNIGATLQKSGVAMGAATQKQIDTPFSYSVLQVGMNNMLRRPMLFRPSGALLFLYVSVCILSQAVYGEDEHLSLAKVDSEITKSGPHPQPLFQSETVSDLFGIYRNSKDVIIIYHFDKTWKETKQSTLSIRSTPAAEENRLVDVTEQNEPIVITIEGSGRMVRFPVGINYYRILSPEKALEFNVECERGTKLLTTFHVKLKGDDIVAVTWTRKVEEE